MLTYMGIDSLNIYSLQSICSLHAYKNQKFATSLTTVTIKLIVQVTLHILKRIQSSYKIILQITLHHDKNKIIKSSY